VALFGPSRLSHADQSQSLRLASYSFVFNHLDGRRWLGLITKSLTFGIVSLLPFFSDKAGVVFAGSPEGMCSFARIYFSRGFLDWEATAEVRTAVIALFVSEVMVPPRADYFSFVPAYPSNFGPLTLGSW